MKVSTGDMAIALQLAADVYICIYLHTYVRTYVCTYAGQFQEWHSRDIVLAETGIGLFQYVKTVKGTCVRASVGR